MKQYKIERKKIILDVDNALTIPVQDTDDAMALALALTSPEVELLGITTSAGNCRTDQSTENTLRILETAGRNDIPVARGCDKPFLQDVEKHFEYLEKKTKSPENVFWKDMPDFAVPKIKASDKKGYELIIELVNKHPGEIYFISLAALSNLAIAILAEPRIVSLIKEVVLMSGQFESEENNPQNPLWKTPDIPEEVWRDYLRFNAAFDPEASLIVFQSGIPLRFVPVNVTVKVFQRLKDIEEIGKGATPFHKLLYDAGRPWVEWSVKVRNLSGAHMHDPLTLASIIKPEYFKFEKMHLDVNGFRSGDPCWLKKIEKENNVWVATEVDAEKFEDYLTKTISGPVG